MDNIKREEFKKMCKKIHKVRARMVAVRMVRMLNMSVDETASIQDTVPREFATGCAVTTKDASKASGIFRCGRPRRSKIRLWIR